MSGKLDDDIIKQGEKLIFNPYNNLNNEITLKDVQSVLNRYGLPGKVTNMKLYKRAFDHRSYTKRPELENEKNNIIITEQPMDCLPLRSKSNERLEFLGDGVLECIVKFYLYRRFPKENEGFMTEKKIALVKNEAIGKIAYEMRLHKWYIISKHAEEKGIRTNHKKLGCLFESFLGALFLDFNKTEMIDENALFANFFVTGPGFQFAQIFVENVLEKHVNWNEIINNDDNFKNILQVKIQKEFKVTPHYIEIEEYDQEIGYTMGVFICLGQQIHEVNVDDAISFRTLGTFEHVHDVASNNDGKAFVFLCKSVHKIKKKAEQDACAKSIELID
jgi:dsRNA-specific ribonuclease